MVDERNRKGLVHYHALITLYHDPCPMPKTFPGLNCQLFRDKLVRFQETYILVITYTSEGIPRVGYRWAGSCSSRYDWTRVFSGSNTLAYYKTCSIPGKASSHWHQVATEVPRLWAEKQMNYISKVIKLITVT
jgi:hypothetical protein